MRLTGPLGFLSMLLFSLSASAQQPSPQPVTPQRDPQALAALAQCVAAVGSPAAISDARAEGTIVLADGTTGPITMKSKGAYKLRNELNINGAQQGIVVNQGKGYAIQGGVRQPQPLWMTAYQQPEYIPALSRVASYTQPNMNVTYVGMEAVGARSAHHILMTALPADSTPPASEAILSEFHVFIDSQSFLPVKTTDFDFSPEIIENRSPVETYYADFQQVGGVLVPYQITRYVAGQQQLQITLTSVNFNVGLSDSDFE